jgi:hypothetical protein
MCCQNVSGILAPEDVGDLSADGIYRLLSTKKYVVDCWEPDNKLPHTRFIRPAHKPSKWRGFAWPVDYTYGGVCIFHTDTGCELALKDRPASCRELEPSEDHGHGCKGGMDKIDRVKTWTPYQSMIEDALKAICDGEEQEES